MKVSFHTLGCKVNFAETSTLAREFAAAGWDRAGGRNADGEDDGGSIPEADVYVVNTCSVTAAADKKCRNLIARLHRRSPSARIVVTGCYAQLAPERLAAIPGVHLVVGNDAKGDLLRRLEGEVAGHCNFYPAWSAGDRTRSFLKVQDGCDYKCAYCTIHYARGESRNIPIAEVVSQAREIAARGVKEVVVTGVNTGDFGRTTGESFLDLLRALDGVEGVERYRISSIEPNLLTDEIIAFCAASRAFQPHFHIPLQSGCDRILGLMRRRYTTARFAERVVRIREKMPDAFIGIDVIVGFPGETEDDFEATRTFLERVRPSQLHVFPYSVRPGTPAATMPGRVPPRVAAERAAALGTLSEELLAEFTARFRGTTAEVLWEGEQKGGVMSGFTGNYLRVTAPHDPALVNTITRAVL
ncbi:MAG: tRNA (N(6)-L-threonylcarbamoyladenosine(37)-C(2))-methylthiotransferase MtaB [Alistipes sp.]|jgi:threonylcarbamoyladenosine tRNA methylthiotransferase MtaB|nr:tRNA (N(6)-L-threonylcarbamoyladenosine(37)-C(2))-methylthiotransferase MtaB [Alistipes sp.]